jgi:hypothetical protein
MFGQDRQGLRNYYRSAWQKALAHQALDALEQQIVAVIAEHPEYQRIIENPASTEQDWLPELGETNPFLHLGMHLAIREQVTTDRPKGIRACYDQLCVQVQDALGAEHQMMDCLAEAIWQAQRHQQAPDEQAYLRCLQRLCQHE